MTNKDMGIINFLFKRINTDNNVILIEESSYRLYLSKRSITTLRTVDTSKYMSVQEGKEHIKHMFYSYYINITLTEYGKAYLDMRKL